MELAQRFAAAQDRVKTLSSSPDTSDLLELYALFKQATLGDATGPRPNMFDMKGRAKFDAWASKKGQTRDAAMQAYVDLVDRLAGK